MRFRECFSLLFILVASNVPLASTAEAGECLLDFREVAVKLERDPGPAAAVRLKDYYCRGAQGPAVRVQFHRVNDFVLTSALEGTLPQGLQAALGNTTYVANSVYSEFSDLMRQFGVTHKGWCELLEINVPEREPQYSDNCAWNNVGKPRKTLGGWASAADLGFKQQWYIALPDDYVVANKRQRTPAGFIRDQNPENPYMWRYMRPDDLADYPSKIARFNGLIRPDIKYFEGSRVVEPNYIRLLRHITKDFFPRDFIVIIGEIKEENHDEQIWTFDYLPRGLELDLVTIENVSGKEITLKEFMGLSTSSRRLRPLATAGEARGGPLAFLPLGPVRLAPGTRLGLVERLIFTTGVRQRGYFDNWKSFPETPSDKRYVYGPEMQLKRFTVDGEAFDLDSRQTNFLNLTAGSSPGASCPFLYAWSEKRSAWVNEGKILDDAKGKSGEQSQRKAFEGFVSRFRLSEEEPEIAYLDKVALIIELHNGATLNLNPDIRMLANVDEQYETLFMGNQVDVSFDLPSGINRDSVKSSTLVVVGYYERYSALYKRRLLSDEPTQQPTYTGLRTTAR